MKVVGEGLVDVAEFLRDKLAWHLQVMCDGRLTSSAKILASLLLHDLNCKYDGFAWRAQSGDDGLAARAGVTTRTIQSGVKELCDAGHLERVVARGRGRSNRYRALLKNTKCASGEGAENTKLASGNEAENTKSASGIGLENTKLASEKHEATFAQTLLRNPLNSPLPPKTAEAGASLASREGGAARSEGSIQSLGELYKRLLLHPKADARIVETYVRAGDFDAESQTFVGLTGTAKHQLTTTCRAAFRDLGVSIAGPGDAP